jgi:hypothetical protein
MEKGLIMKKLFSLTNGDIIVCESEGTRYGFRHLATLMRNGYEVSKAKVCYYNRTWEAYEFDTVIHKLMEEFYGEDLHNPTKNIKVIGRDK